MARRSLALLAVVLVVAAAAWLLVGRGRGGDPAPPGAGASSPAEAGAERGGDPARPAAGVAAPRRLAAAFETRREVALERFRGELVFRLENCVAPPGAPPARSRPVRFRFEWDPRGAQAGAQRWVVKGAALLEAGAPPHVGECLEQLEGAPLFVEVAPEAVPEEARAFEQVLEVTIP